MIIKAGLDRISVLFRSFYTCEVILIIIEIDEC